MEIAVKDGVKYLLHQYKDESELENLVKKHIEFIFGESSLFFEKSKIESKSGIGSIPDGFILSLPHKKWYILEIELSTHPLHDHIVSQLSRFRAAINNLHTRQELIDTFYDEITKDPNLEYKYKTISTKIGVNTDLHKLLTDIIRNEPEIVIIIDEKTNELEEVCTNLPFKSTVIKFKTYKRESSNVLVYVFDTLVHYTLDSTKEEPLLIREQGQTIEISLSGDETLDQILKVARLVLKQGKSFSEAVKIVAREKNIHESTVRDKCTRRIGLNTEQFQELLKDSARLTNFLIKKFPAGVQIIYEDLK